MIAKLPTLYFISGPNGAGKTTYAYRQIREVSRSNEFVNLDEIARGLSPFNPQGQASRAARVALEMTHDLVAARRTFSIETTLAGKTHLRTIAAARTAGFKIVLLYFAVADPAICLARIARRVSEGGHDVPEPDVRRRFSRSLANLSAYAAQCDLWRVFDTGLTPAKVVAEGRADCAAMRGELSGLPGGMAGWIGALPACAEQQ